MNPVFSPDGKWLAFLAGGKLKKVSLDGGTPVILAEKGIYVQGAVWATDHKLLLSFAELQDFARQ